MKKNFKIINPLESIDYIHYTLAFIVGEKIGYFKEKEFIVSALFGMLQLMNIVTIVLFIWRPLPSTLKSYDIQIESVAYILIVLLNIIRYKNKYTELSHKWHNDKNIALTLKRSAVILYLIMTYVLLIYSITNI
ncbi:hypothetical protein [Carboxylicivirga caseinilyticus]|uniref:hypothetical protein n=1 Tax=Carboxylicivirga caseinilyticus TaxID=3417572 RepID=UPI003D33F387|nr:hypothetical protein [Marinilabiliaceae bacterium A049]